MVWWPRELHYVFALSYFQKRIRKIDSLWKRIRKIDSLWKRIRKMDSLSKRIRKMDSLWKRIRKMSKRIRKMDSQNWLLIRCLLSQLYYYVGVTCWASVCMRGSRSVKLRGREDELKHSGRGREYIPSWSVGCHVTEISTGWVCSESGVSNGWKTTSSKCRTRQWRKCEKRFVTTYIYKLDSLTASHGPSCWRGRLRPVRYATFATYPTGRDLCYVAPDWPTRNIPTSSSRMLQFVLTSS